MLVNVEKGELLAGFAGLKVRPLQHDDQPLLLLLGNLEKQVFGKVFSSAAGSTLGAAASLASSPSSPPATFRFLPIT